VIVDCELRINASWEGRLAPPAALESIKEVKRKSEPGAVAGPKRQLSMNQMWLRAPDETRQHRQRSLSLVSLVAVWDPVATAPGSDLRFISYVDSGETAGASRPSQPALSEIRNSPLYFAPDKAFSYTLSLSLSCFWSQYRHC
jgi:hypothetical protein